MTNEWSKNGATVFTVNILTLPGAICIIFSRLNISPRRCFILLRNIKTKYCHLSKFNEPMFLLIKIKRGQYI